jgi:hypothetical protein
MGTSNATLYSTSYAANIAVLTRLAASSQIVDTRHCVANGWRGRSKLLAVCKFLTLGKVLGVLGTSLEGCKSFFGRKGCGWIGNQAVDPVYPGEGRLDVWGCVGRRGVGGWHSGAQSGEGEGSEDGSGLHGVRLGITRGRVL